MEKFFHRVGNIQQILWPSPSSSIIPFFTSFPWNVNRLIKIKWKVSTKYFMRSLIEMTSVSRAIFFILESGFKCNVFFFLLICFINCMYLITIKDKLLKLYDKRKRKFEACTWLLSLEEGESHVRKNNIIKCGSYLGEF